jgi:hypothetical protein
MTKFFSNLRCECNTLPIPFYTGWSQVASQDRNEVNFDIVEMSFLRNNSRKNNPIRDISDIQYLSPKVEVTIFARRNKKKGLNFQLTIQDTMDVHDSNQTDDHSKSFSSSSEKDDGSQTSATTRTDSSWSLASKETKQVNRSKVLLLGVMAISAAVLGLLTFLIFDEDEEDDFRAAVS